MPVAGHSLRASCPSLARCFLRFAILASRRKQRRLPGTGSPSQPLVAQVGNLWLSWSTGFQPVCPPRSHWARVRFRKGEQSVGGTRRSRCDLCTARVRQSDRAENSQVPPAPSMSPADCGAATTHADQLCSASGVGDDQLVGGVEGDREARAADANPHQPCAVGVALDRTHRAEHEAAVGEVAKEIG